MEWHGLTPQSSGHWYAHLGCSVNFQGAPPCCWHSLQWLAYGDGCHANNICLLCQFLLFQRRETVPGIKWALHHGTHKLFPQRLLVPLQKQRGRKESWLLCQTSRHVRLLNNCYALENKLRCFFKWVVGQNSALRKSRGFTWPCKYNFNSLLSQFTNLQWLWPQCFY